MHAKKTCFVSGKKKVEAKKYFEAKRGSILSSRDDIKEIECRYAPVGSFEISWEDKVETGFISKVEKTSRISNVFYVNLNDAKLYYVSKSLLGRPGIKASDAMEKIIDLPPMAVEFLSDIARKGRIKHPELDKKHFLFLNGNFDMIMMLKTRGLITFNATACNIKGSRVYSIREYFSRMNMLYPGNRRYNLGAFLSTEQRNLKVEKVDEIAFEPGDIRNTLEIFLQGRGKPHSIFYLPYYQCKYVDREGRFRYSRLISPRFSVTP